MTVTAVSDPITLPADGPDEMGREIAEGPAAVEATLGALARPGPAVADRLADAARTVVVGTGASMVMAQAAVPLWRMARRALGDHRPVLVREATGVVFGVDGEALREGDVVVAISYRGTSPETVGAAEVARRAGCPVIAVTRDGGSPLATAATAVVGIHCGAEETGAATKSELATLAALLAMGGALALDEVGVAALRRRLEAAVRDWERCAALGRSLAASERLWAVGLGSGEGVVRAACLLWHEKVTRPAVPLSVSDFRHGPAEATRAADGVLVIDVAPSTEAQRGYLALLASELRQLACTVAWVGPDAPSDLGGIAVADRGPEATLEATLRVQQLARATAHAAGTYVEEFRVLKEIVKPSPPLA
jgi:glucosamine--fructose-6-phosphate aminotransferase (isomerizing)